MQCNEQKNWSEIWIIRRPVNQLTAKLQRIKAVASVYRDSSILYLENRRCEMDRDTGKAGNTAIIPRFPAENIYATLVSCTGI